MSKEPLASLLPETLNEDGGEGSKDYFSELEKDLLLTFEEQGKLLSAPAASSLYAPCCSTEPSHAQISQDHEQDATSQGRLEGLQDNSKLCD